MAYEVERGHRAIFEGMEAAGGWMDTGGAWCDRRGGACLVQRRLLVRSAYESRKVSTGKRGLSTHLGSGCG